MILWTMHGRTRHKIQERGTWLQTMGLDVAGKTPEEIWQIWGQAIRLLYRDHSMMTASQMFLAMEAFKKAVPNVVWRRWMVEIDDEVES